LITVMVDVSVTGLGRAKRQFVAINNLLVSHGYRPLFQ
jgi:hypothetical protein